MAGSFFGATTADPAFVPLDELLAEIHLEHPPEDQLVLEFEPYPQDQL